MNIQFYIIEREAGKLAGKLECTTDKIGRVLKASLLEQKTSPYFRELGKGQKVEEEQVDLIEEKLDPYDKLDISTWWVKLCNEEPKAASWMQKNSELLLSGYEEFKKVVMSDLENQI